MGGSGQEKLEMTVMDPQGLYGDTVAQRQTQKKEQGMKAAQSQKRVEGYKGEIILEYKVPNSFTLRIQYEGNMIN